MLNIDLSILLFSIYLKLPIVTCFKRNKNASRIMSSKSREGGTFAKSFYKARNTFIQNQTKQVLKNENRNINVKMKGNRIQK